MDKPPRYRRTYAERFTDPAVVQAYLSRPRYPRETFEVLAGLAADRPKRVLDVGCGTGEIARHLAPFVDLVVAVDFSEPMVEAARRLPGGDRTNIAWKVGPIEEVPLDGPHSLIVGGQSLHWMDWNVVFPRFRRALSGHGCLAVVDLDVEPPPWEVEVKRIIGEYSTNPDYRPYDMVGAWEKAGAFEKVGEKKTAPVKFRQTLDGYLEYLHSMSSLTRSSMGEPRARKFDQEVRRAVGRFRPGETVESAVFATVAWGTLPR